MDTEMWYCFALLALLFFFYTKTGRVQNGKKKSRPPSPPGLPILGHVHLIEEPLHRCLQSMSDRYGPVFHLRLGCLPVLVVSSPEAVEECFTRNDVVFASRPELHLGEFFGYNHTNLVWTPYGDHWRDLRRFTAIHVFSSHVLQGYAALRTEEVRFVAREMLIGPSNDPSAGQKVDLGKAFTKIAWNVVMTIVNGKRWSNVQEAKYFAPLKLMTVFYYFPALRWLVEMEIIYGCPIYLIIRPEYMDENPKKSG